MFTRVRVFQIDGSCEPAILIISMKFNINGNLYTGQTFTYTLFSMPICFVFAACMRGILKSSSNQNNFQQLSSQKCMQIQLEMVLLTVCLW